MRYLMTRPRRRRSPGGCRWRRAFSASYSVECTSLTTGLVSSLMVLSDRSSPRCSALAPPLAARQQAVHRAQRFLVARQVGRDVGAVRQAPAETAGHALLRPRLQVAVERIADDQHQRRRARRATPGIRAPAPRRTAARRRPAPVRCSSSIASSGIVQRRRQRLRRSVCGSSPDCSSSTSDDARAAPAAPRARRMHLLRRKPRPAATSMGSAIFTGCSRQVRRSGNTSAPR